MPCGHKDRKEVESLISAREQTGSVMDSPAQLLAAEVLAGSGAALQAGRQVGLYKIIALIGAGGSCLKLLISTTWFVAVPRDSASWRMVLTSIRIASSGSAHRFPTRRELLHIAYHHGISRRVAARKGERMAVAGIREIVDKI